jgi:mRNA interferase RelE/StbE
VRYRKQNAKSSYADWSRARSFVRICWTWRCSRTGEARRLGPIEPICGIVRRSLDEICSPDSSVCGERDLNRLPDFVFRRINERLLSLEDDPRPPGVKRLSHRGEYRLRVGDYRVLYEVDDKEKTVEIVSVGHRRDVYR